MRLTRLAIEGITSYVKQAVVDFQAIGPGVIAIAGPNGAGKTSLLECAGPGALFRTLPTRNPSNIADWARNGNASLQLTFEARGSTYEIDLQIRNGKQTSYIKVNGRKRVTGKVSEHDELIRALLGPPHALYASVFGMQGGGGRFQSLRVSERKQAFAVYLGLADLPKILERVKQRLAAVDATALAEIEAEIAGIEREELPSLLDAKKTATIAWKRSRYYLKCETERIARYSSEAHLIDLRARLDAALDRIVEIEDEMERLADVDVPDDPDIEGARESLAVAREHAARIDALDAEHKAARSEAESLTLRMRDAERLASLLTDVPCRGAGQYMRCPLLVESRDAADKLPELQEGVASQQQTIDSLAQQAADARLTAPNLVAAEARVRAAEIALRSAADKAAEARQNKRSRERLEQQHEDVLTIAIKLQRQMPEGPIDEDLPTKEAMDRLVRKCEEAQVRFEAAVQSRAEAKALVTATREHLRNLKSKRDRLREKSQDAEPLRLLAQALGPDGVLAFEIAAAGPRVTELANELLRSCYGPRFSIEISTLKELKKGGYAEDFGVRVYDSQEGVWHASLTGPSVGEGVIVDEALRLALSLFAAERSGVPCQTLYRDETIGGLDADNAARYVAMLHRARELGGFCQVLYVTHDERAIGSADAVIRVDEGKVRIDT